jgi:predicted acyltransferase
LVYLLARGKPAPLVGATALMVCVYIASRASRLPFPESIGRYWPPGLYLGSVSAIVVAGAVAGLIVARRSPPGGWWRLMGYGAALWAAGWLLRPLYGYSKNAATESWSLVAAGQGTLMLAVCRQLLDRWKPHFLAFIAMPVVLIGRNALLAFILPNFVSMFVRTLGWELMPLWDRGGMLGMLNAGFYAMLIGGITAAATRAGLILRL